jgi:hypothetical protein
VVGLGLPLRAGEEPPRGEWLLAGASCAEAEAEWSALTASLPRPIALVNPFGGSEPLKGYSERRLGVLAEGIGGLVAEGFGVVLLPNGTPWGGTATAEAVLARLSAGVRARVVVAPDPGDTPAAADRVMRWFKYFATWADVVVTVEGWLVHLAYALGRPYRLLMLPRSHGFEWHPFGAGPGQRAAAGMSPRAPVPDPAHDLPGGPDGPPLPAEPRKGLLLLVLAALGETRQSRVVPALVDAMRSADHDVRAAAAAALARVPGDEAARALTAAVSDPAWRVRAAAAGALLARPAAAGGPSSPPDRRRLRCHVWIARRRWPAVLAAGAAALPALAVAVKDPDAVVAREAAWAARRIVTRP